MFQFSEDICINISILVLILMIIILLIRYFKSTENFAGTIQRRRTIINKKKKVSKTKSKPKHKPKPKTNTNTNSNQQIQITPQKQIITNIQNKKKDEQSSISSIVENNKPAKHSQNKEKPMHNMGLGQILESVGDIVISKDRVKIGSWTLKKD